MGNISATQDEKEQEIWAGVFRHQNKIFRGTEKSQKEGDRRQRI